MTDADRGYLGHSESYKDAWVDHAIKYAAGQVHTNGIENFWSLFDRAVHRTYIRPEAQHLPMSRLTASITVTVRTSQDALSQPRE